MAFKSASWTKVKKAVNNRASFTQGNMSGRWVDDVDDTCWGQLPQEHKDQLKADLIVCPRYVVFSYQTPIGWAESMTDKNKWTIPNVRYSVTTTQHQSVLAFAANQFPKSINDHLPY